MRARATMAVAAPVLALLLAAAVLPAVRSAPAAAGPTRPNVVVIMMDDLSLTDLPHLGRVGRLLGEQGTTFSRFYVGTPECCPSRATFLTGQYPHNHGVLSGEEPTGGYYHLDHGNTLPVWLQANGYHTAHVGKYLNQVGTVDPTDRPAGWDDYYGLVDPTTYRYWNYTVNDNGVLRTYGTTDADYNTDVMGRAALDAVNESAADPRPLFLYFAPLSTHSATRTGTGWWYPIPAPRHDRTMRSIAQPRGADFNEADVSDKPAAVRNLPLLTSAQLTSQQSWFSQTIENGQAADEAIGALFDALAATGRLDDTVVIFVSDNGFLRGEHRLVQNKAVPYEPAVHVPLIIRGPGFPAGATVTAPVTMADLAPTIAALTGTAPGRTVDGTSLLPLVADPSAGQSRSLLMEVGPLYNRVTWQAVRGPRWKYVEYSTGERELYDLTADPLELRNRAADPSVAWIRTALAARLATLGSCAGATCVA